MLIVHQPMGYADRDYHRAGPQKPPSRFAGIPVVKWLLVSNIIIFLIDVIYRPEMPKGQVGEGYIPSGIGKAGVFSVETALMGGQVWRLISFQFLHSNFMHLAMNMWALFVFGPFLERWWRSKAFLYYYLLCGIGGAALYSLLVFVPGILPDALVGQRLLGASAGVFGVLVGVAVLAPQAKIHLLFPPIAMKMRTFALIFLGLEVFLLLSNSSNAGGSAGHLGGALVGYLFMKVGPLRTMLLKLASSKGVSVKIVKKPKAESKFRPKSELSGAESSQVDRILDKINNEGLQSLTDGERDLLRRAAGE